MKQEWGVLRYCLTPFELLGTLDQLSQKTLVSSIFGLIFKIFNKVWDVTHFLIWNLLAKVSFFFSVYLHETIQFYIFKCERGLFKCNILQY